MSEELETSAGAPEAKEEEQLVPLDQMRVALVVGVLPDGKFIFQTHGTNQGLVEYIGIHTYAGYRIQSLADEVIFRGDRITHEVGKAVGLLNQKVDELAARLLPAETVEGGAPSEEEKAPE